MDKPLHLLDDNFRSQLATKCDLFLYIGSNFIQYAIIDHVQDQLKCIYESETGIVPANYLSELTHTHQYLKYNFRKVKTCVESFEFTFIPETLYAEQDVYQYAKFIGATNPAEIVVSNITRQIKSVSLVKVSLQESINANFPDTELYAQDVPAVLAAIQQFYGHAGKGLYIILRNNKLEITLISDSTLLFYNIYECFNADEYNYYLLNLINQYTLQEEHCPVVLAGAVFTNDEIYLRTIKYFSEISFADTKKLVTQPSIFDNISGQEFFPLLSQNLCA